MCSIEIDPDLEPGGADPVVVRVVDVERQLKRTARQTDPGDGDFLQLDVRFGERQAAEGGARERKERDDREAGCEMRDASVHLPFPPPASRVPQQLFFQLLPELQDRKSTRLNSSHSQISYAVFCLKKKKNVVIDISTSYG